MLSTGSHRPTRGPGPVASVGRTAAGSDATSGPERESDSGSGAAPAGTTPPLNRGPDRDETQQYDLRSDRWDT